MVPINVPGCVFDSDDDFSDDESSGFNFSDDCWSGDEADSSVQVLIRRIPISKADI